VTPGFRFCYCLHNLFWTRQCKGVTFLAGRKGQASAVLTFVHKVALDLGRWVRKGLQFFQGQNSFVSGTCELDFITLIFLSSLKWEMGKIIMW
jgi:hypothetical protein